ncbi:MAG: DUF1987 domain-containing protein [Flavobacteriales bacterium]|nr:DUF1987 domain-containing protein [Flavobacteriales bacterium]
MDSIFIEGTPKTPNISFDNGKGALLLKGRSIPENSIEFYKPLVDWLDAYSNAPQPKTVCDIQLEYFNTSSSKCLLDLFKKMENMSKNGNEIIINWYYEEDDEDMLEAGEDYQSIINVPFKMIEMQD